MRLDLERCWMYYTAGLWSETIICFLMFCQVPTSWGSRRRDQGAAPLPLVTLQSGIRSILKCHAPLYLRRRTVSSAAFHCGIKTVHFLLSPPVWVLSSWDWTEITNFAALQDNPFILINTPLQKRLLKQHIIITFHRRGGNKFPYLNMNFEMLIFLFRRVLYCDLNRDSFNL